MSFVSFDIVVCYGRKKTITAKGKESYRCCQVPREKTFTDNETDTGTGKHHCEYNL